MYDYAYKYNYLSLCMIVYQSIISIELRMILYEYVELCMIMYDYV